MGQSILHYIPYPLTLQTAATGTGNGTEMELNGKYGTLVVRVLGITSATVTFEAMRTNVVGDAYAAITGTNIATGAFVSSTTTNGTFIFDVRGVWKFRARISAYATGTIYVHATATAQDGSDANKHTVAIDQTTQGITNGVAVNGTTLKGANVASVTTAGTRVQLPSLACREVTCIARRGNTGYIYLGMNNVSSAVYGVNLAALESFTFVVSNLNEIWMDASVSGEGISYVAL